MQRLRALAAFMAVVGALLGLLAMSPLKPGAVRDDVWLAALLLLLLGTGTTVALGVGVPLVSRRVYVSAGFGAGVLMLAGVAIAGDPSLLFERAGVAMGIRCFVFGSVISGAAMVALGLLSGRVWRRFPDPGLLLAVGVTGVGIAGLHLRCAITDPAHLFLYHVTPLVLLYAATRFLVRLRERTLRDS